MDWGSPFYVAEQVALGAPVLLKVFAARPDGEHVAQSLAEARAASRAHSARVPNAYDMGRLSDGSAYLVLDYVDAPSLRTLLRGGPLPQTLALELSTQLAAALSALHHAGVAHGRLTADDIILHEPGSGVPFVRLVDAGACIPIDPLRIASVDDVRSLGGLVLQMWLGHPVARRERDAALARAGIPEGLRSLVEKACAGKLDSADRLREGLRATPAGAVAPLPLCRPRAVATSRAADATRNSATKVRVPLARWWVATIVLLVLTGAVGLAQALGWTAWIRTFVEEGYAF